MKFVPKKQTNPNEVVVLWLFLFGRPSMASPNPRPGQPPKRSQAAEARGRHEPVVPAVVAKTLEIVLAHAAQRSRDIS